MQKLAEICIHRPIFATIIVMTLMVIGVASYLHLTVNRFPSINIPVIHINTQLPNTSPTEMESTISQPIKKVINTIEGIDELRSVNGSDSSFVIITFDLKQNIDIAA